MSGLMNCGLCCMLISIWAVIQLFFMGIFYYIEAVVLFDDVEAVDYDDYDDFIKKTENNYRATAINCWIAAAIYVFTLGLSCTCIRKARRKEQKLALMLSDDEYACTLKKKEPKKKKL